MAKTPSQLSPEVLAAAMEGLTLQRQRIDDQIAEIRQLLRQSGHRSGKSAAAEKSAPAPSRGRNLSAAARQRIAEAQRKRWAAYRKEKSADE